MMKTVAGKLAAEGCQRFPAMSSHGLAAMLFARHRGVYKSVEHARDHVRYVRQEGGTGKRKRVKEPVATTKRRIPETLAEERHDFTLQPGRWLVLSDMHVPFHSEKAMEAAMKYASERGVNNLLLNGDIHDCEAVGYWQAHARPDFVKEVEAMVDMLDWMSDAITWKHKVYKPGNHEDRLVRYYYQQAPALAHQHANIVDVLELERRRYEWLGVKQKVKAGDHLHILHGHELRKVPYLANPARWLFNKVNACAVCGHWHTTNQYNKNTINDVLLATWTTGCMCDLHPDYNPFGNEWNWGFAEIDVEKGGAFELVNRRILHNGKVV